MQTSRSNTNETIELTRNNRVDYFRHLVVGDSSPRKEDCAVESAIISLTCVDLMDEVGTHNRMEFPFGEGINESCHFEDADINSDALEIVKDETDGTSDCLVYVESFPQDIMKNPTHSLFPAPNAPACSTKELPSEPEEIEKADLEYHDTFCEKPFVEKVSLEINLKQHLDKKTINLEKCEGSFLSGNDLIFHENQTSKNCEVVNTEGITTLIELTLIDLPLNGNKPGVKHDEKKNSCEVCEKGDASSEQFSSLHSLTCYKRIHTGEVKYKCDYCGKEFGKRHLLIGHRSSHTGGRTLTPGHIKIHTGEKPFKCDVCNKTFLKLKGLTIHKRIHSGERPYKCDFCNKSFVQSSPLALHTRIHTGEKPYKCDVCNKSFGQSTTLARHKRIHTGEKPYKCDICKKKFSRSSSLTIHTRIHTGERPYICDVCNKSFKQFNALITHKRTHTDESNALNIHKIIPSVERPYKCDVCNRSFVRSTPLAIHKRIHTGEKPYKCDVCNKTFSRSGILSIHKRIHTGERPYKCDVCNMSFKQSNALIVHKRTHTGEKIYICDICNKSFVHSNSLAIHKKIHNVTCLTNALPSQEQTASVGNPDD